MRLYFENASKVTFTTRSGLQYDVLVFSKSCLAIPRDIESIEIHSFEF